MEFGDSTFLTDLNTDEVMPEVLTGQRRKRPSTEDFMKIKRISVPTTLDDWPALPPSPVAPALDNWPALPPSPARSNNKAAKAIESENMVNARAKAHRQKTGKVHIRDEL